MRGKRSPFNVSIVFLLLVGLAESESIINKHISEISQQQQAKEEYRQRNAQLLEVSNFDYLSNFTRVTVY
jgi:hypothetical protein